MTFRPMTTLRPGGAAFSPAGLLLRTAFAGPFLVLLASCSAIGPPQRAHRREEMFREYDIARRFAEAGAWDVATDHFNKAILIGEAGDWAVPRSGIHFQFARMCEAAGDSDLAARAHIRALSAEPGLWESRSALAAMGFDPPSEETARRDPKAMEAFAAAAAAELDRRRDEAERRAAASGAGSSAARARALKRMKEAAEGRPPSPEEVRAVLFLGAASGDDEPMPSAEAAPSGREIILNTFPYHFANGLRLQKNQQYERAAAEYQLAVQLNPGSMDARINLGDCMLRLERFPQAEHHYIAAVDLDPASPRPWLKMGNLHEALKRWDRARENYRLALAKDPNFTEAYNNLAALEIREKNHAAAIELLRKVIAIRPDYTLAWLNLGVAQENSGDAAGALESYRRYVELGGERAAEVRRWIAELESP